MGWKLECRVHLELLTLYYKPLFTQTMNFPLSYSLSLNHKSEADPGGGDPGGQGTPKLNKEGKNVVRVRGKVPRFST